MLLTVLMPSLNEEKSIQKTIQSIPVKKLRQLGFGTEILLVDGHSTDHTAKLARSAGARVIFSPPGYGRQYLTGFQKAQGAIIATADSDCSYPLPDLPSLLTTFQNEQLEFLSTNRFAKMSANSMRPINFLGNKILTFICNRLFSLHLKDSQSGMWLFQKKALRKIKLQETGMALSQEIKIEAFKKLKAKEVPSSYQKRVGRVKLRIIADGWKNLKHLFVKRLAQ